MKGSMIMDRIRISTIGFTKKSAEEFFEMLRASGIARVIDIRLNNTSQLAGFTKSADLAYFLKVILGVSYLHLPELAPTQEMLTRYRDSKGGWPAYEATFRKLLEERRVEDGLDRSLFDNACLLCSEATPSRCHRRLVAEYLGEKWGSVEIHHL
jgi:uncharacterized protein (DUF488 family)